VDLAAFLDAVAVRCGTTLDGASDRTDAVLSVLAEHLTPEAAAHVRAQLPEALQEPLLSGGSASFDRETFVLRIAARAGLAVPEARAAADVVVGVLAEAVDAGAYRHLAAQLPPGFLDPGDALSRAIGARPDARRWRPTARPREWELTTGAGDRGVVAEVGGAYEARVWRRATGPSPRPDDEPLHGPQVFDEPGDALAYIEHDLGTAPM
jgi:uncharacterized protein (DUF2267 family)